MQAALLLSLQPPLPLLTDLRNVTVLLGGKVLFAPGKLMLRAGDRWRDGEELTLASAESSYGHDALGRFERVLVRYALDGQDDILHLSIRQYAGGGHIAFEQSLPRGLQTSGGAALGRPLVAYPSWSLSAEPVARLGWRSWHGHWGSFSGIGLSAGNSIVFNGVPTMPVLLFGEGSHAAAVLSSPLDNFKAAAHAAFVRPDNNNTDWQHGPSGAVASLPALYSHTTLLSAALGPTRTIDAHGGALRRWHRTNRSAAAEADVTLRQLGLWTDNGAYYNFNKWAGNEWPGRRWSPRDSAGSTPEALLLRAVGSLRAARVPVRYIQLDDWWYVGTVHEGAVACVSNWSARPDWFPHGLRGLSERAGVPLMLYVPYFCNDTTYAARNGGRFDFDDDGVARPGGVPDAPDGSPCPWPVSDTRRACNRSYAAPNPRSAQALYTALLGEATQAGMVAFEHDFVGQGAGSYGWPSRLDAAARWLDGMGAAAEATATPTQWCLATGRRDGQ